MLEITSIKLGEEISVSDFDERMIDEGFYSEYDSFDDQTLESGAIIYTLKEDSDITVRVEFEVSEYNENDPKESYITVTDIQVW